MSQECGKLKSAPLMDPPLAVRSALTTTLPEVVDPCEVDSGMLACHGERRAVDRLVLEHRRYGSFEQAEELRGPWDELAAAEADFYSSFDWCSLWWRYYGAARDLEIHAYFADGALVGIAPLFRESIRLGLARVRVVRIVGCDHSTVTCGLPLRREYEEGLVAAIIREILADNWDLVHLGRLPPYSAGARTLFNELSVQPQVAYVERACDSLPETLVDLPATFDEYLGGLSSRERQNIRKENRRLSVQHQMEFDDAALVNGPAAAMREFIELHQSQWREKGHHGHFEDWPAAREFHLALATVQHAAGRLMLHRVRADGKPFAMEYGFRFGNRLHWFLSARSTASGWHFCSPGRVGACDLIRKAIEMGVREFEMGIGYYPYKLKLGGRLVPVTGIRAVRVGAEWKVGVFRLIALAHDLIGHRLWYQRIAPLLPSVSTGLNRGWIRSRIWSNDASQFALACRERMCALASIMTSGRRCFAAGEGLRGVIHSVRSALFRFISRRRIEYGVTIDALAQNGADAGQMRVRRVRVFRELDEAEVQQSALIGGAVSVIQIRQTLNVGGELWVASIGDDMVGFCWAASTRAARVRASSPRNSDLVIRGFVVAPGVQESCVLPAILHELAVAPGAEGVERVLATCPAWDTAAQRMLLNAGFQALNPPSGI